MKQAVSPLSAPESTLLAYARRFLRSQAEALLEVGVDQEFTRAVDVLVALPTTARVVVSGIGKAGYIGMKLSATLASLGIPSFFVHPSEAAHGDLGRYREGDVALILSNSGETEEVLRTLRGLKELKCTLISITRDASSTVARASDIPIVIGRVEEGCPLGLAPTTSTTVMLAVGDALAVTSAYARGLTREEYLKFHPGGALGRELKLTLTSAAEVMRAGEYHCIVEETRTAREVLHSYSRTAGRPGAASIVNGEGRLVGVFTDGNLRRSVDAGTEFLDGPISAVMSHAPRTVPGEALASDALDLLRRYEIDQVIVVDAEHRPVGMIDIQDLVRLMGQG